MNKIKKNIPNCITLLNILAGSLAIVSASYSTTALWGLRGFQWAFIFMGIAAVADFLDGMTARLINAYSEVGKELDSLCDVVSFGVAPSMTLFFLLRDFGNDNWLCWTTFLIPICAALRLARFNVDTRQTTTFIGLPVPANAIFWIGYAALIYEGIEFLSRWEVFIAFLVAECFLMNSNIRMLSLKFKNLSFAYNWQRYLIIIAAGVFCFMFGVGGLFWLIIFYLFCSISFNTKNSGK